MSSDQPARQGVPLSPSLMIEDTAADWTLTQVVESQRRKSLSGDSKQETTFLFCRHAFKSMIHVVDLIARRYSISRNKASCIMSYHGLCIVKEDPVIMRLVSTCDIIRSTSLLTDDTDRLDMMEYGVPYAPIKTDKGRVKIMMFDWVSSEFGELSMSCGVDKLWLVQLYMLKSVLTDSTTDMAGTADRLHEEVERWDRWMGMRANSLSGLLV